MQNEKGFFHTVSKDGKVYGDDFENPEDADYILLRKNADMAYFLFKQLFLLRKRGSGETAGRYGTGLRKFCDALLCFWDRHGGFGQFIDMRNEEIVLGGTASAGILPATLVLAYRFFGDSRYLDAACEAAKGYYEDYTKKGLTNGGPSEIGQCPDSESAFALLESFVVLYENTNDVKWLEMSKDAAYQALSWVVSYRFDFPESSEFGRLGVDTTGSVFANVQNKHSAPGICTLSGDSLLKLYRHTGDEMFMDRLEKIAGGITQYLSREGRIIHSWDGRPLPQGFINERVNMSDWEGKDRIGGVFYGSCWSEVSCMLSYNELPGVYVDKERGKAWALDNVVVEFVGDDKIEIENPTEYDARLKIYVDCPVKKTLHENFFPIFKRR
jgi:hypothetical protein